MKQSAAENGQITVCPCGSLAPRSVGDSFAKFCPQSANG
jgi:hypothetical protein